MTAGVVAELEARFDCASRARVSASGPLELRGPLSPSKLYYIRNVTAGVFAGDSFHTTVHCDPGARALVESPSASKVYSMPSGSATAGVELCAEPGSRLVWGPHATILQAGASLRQETRVIVHAGATVLIAETLVMGRIAAGQRFDFNAYESSFEVSDDDGDLLYTEAYALQPCPDLVSAMGGLGVLTCVYALGAIDPDAHTCLEAVRAPRAHTGCSALPNRCGLVLKALTATLSEGTTIARETLKALHSDTPPRSPLPLPADRSLPAFAQR
jgi:urease accessory protein